MFNCIFCFYCIYALECFSISLTKTTKDNIGICTTISLFCVFPPGTGRVQWIVTDISLDMTFPSGSVYQRGILAVTSASRFIVEFEDHWLRIDENRRGTRQEQENPWFRAWFEENNDCSFTPSSGIK